MRTLLEIIGVFAIIFLFFFQYEYQERCFFEGQKEALEGYVYIKKNESGKYYWISSPWKDKSLPDYQPTYFESKPYSEQNNILSKESRSSKSFKNQIPKEYLTAIEYLIYLIILIVLVYAFIKLYLQLFQEEKI